ncbi:MAG: phosphopentomutase [Bacillota bacterium]|nr:phosphopentomutase [Bacillota bacterium]
MMARAIVIVLDSVGIGEMPDACCYGDEGSNTLKNTAAAVGGLKVPNLEKMGLGHIEHIKGVRPLGDAVGAFGKMNEQAKGKDTTSGHWEMMGHILEEPFPTFPDGFPRVFLDAFEQKIGRKTLGNKVASGTVIIEELGKEHMETGYPIVYTSADSVFQIAAHEEIIPLEEQYRICNTAREMLQGEYGVGRVIARPFIGQPGAFVRTPNRHDFSRLPGNTVLDSLLEAGLPTVGVGKISDIFATKGISQSFPTKNNRDGMDKLLQAMEDFPEGLIFVNLVDFDMLYGHRNNPEGYAHSLEEFDELFAGVLDILKEDDLLMITADHGCDPTTVSTDHSREYVPILAYHKLMQSNVDLKIRNSFADLGATVAEHLGVNTAGVLPGESFYSLVRK